MTKKSEPTKGAGVGAGTSVATKAVPVITRSNDVPSGLPYQDYKPYLRRDFWYACAYCTMTESEAKAVRLTIDHYEPVSARPELKDVYLNLMYACDECNTRKGKRCPTEEMRRDGKRFFRADEDIRSEHFELEGSALKGKSNVGNYTILAVDLNRGTLIRLRELRARLIEDEGYVSEGMRALASFAVDRLAPEVRAKALALIKKGLEVADKVYDDMDEMVLEMSKSDILADEKTEEDIRANRERLARLHEMEGLYPVAWRGRKTKKKRH